MIKFLLERLPLRWRWAIGRWADQMAEDLALGEKEYYRRLRSVEPPPGTYDGFYDDDGRHIDSEKGTG